MRRARAFRLDTPTRGRAAVDVRVLGVASRAGCAGWLGGAERAGFRPQTRKTFFCRMTRRRATKREREAGSSTTHRETARAAVCATRFLEGVRSARARAVDGARAREGNCLSMEGSKSHRLVWEKGGCVATGARTHAHPGYVATHVAMDRAALGPSSTGRRPARVERRRDRAVKACE